MQPKIVLEEDSEDDDIYVKKIKELKLKKLKMNSLRLKKQSNNFPFLI